MFGIDKMLRDEVRIESVANYANETICTNMNLPLTADACTDKKIKNSIAVDATRYLCNAAYFHMLKKMKEKAVFIHIPTIKNARDTLWFYLREVVEKLQINKKYLQNKN